MPGWGSMAKKDATGPGSSALAANADEAPRYGAPPSATSTPTPTSSQLAGQNQITPNYLSGATPSGSSPYQQASTGSSAAPNGMQPQRGFYPQSPTGNSANTGYASTSQTSGGSSQYASQYAGGQPQQGGHGTQPSSGGYGMPGSTSTMPAAYTASAPSQTTYGSGSTAPMGYSPAPQPYTQNSGTSSAYSGGTAPQQGSIYGSSSYGGSTGYPSTGSSAPSYPSTSTGSSAYPSTGSSSGYPSTGASSAYPSTSSYSTGPAPNPNDYKPMTSPSYQTASAAGSASGSHYRPGGTADYSGSGQTSSPTTSRYGSTDYPASTDTR